MAVITNYYALGNHVYDFTVSIECKEKVDNIAYQLSFEPDRYDNKTTVTLVKLVESEKEYFCSDIRKTVISCFEGYFEKFPTDTVYFETELSYEKNAVKFLKFYRWALMYRDDYSFEFEVVDKLQEHKNVLYAYVSITKK